MYASPAERQGQSPVPAAASVALAGGELVPDGEQRSLLASPVFWLGGVASVLVWTGLALAILRLA